MRLGSPPRMRGKPRLKGTCITERGITPAHAGKTFVIVCRNDLEGDHPRACGENAIPLFISPCARGSPPRMRGKPGMGGKRKAISGITPAHAGKTPLYPEDDRGIGDHPRACGENWTTCIRRWERRGSPPRMRGKHFGKGVFPWLILVLSLDPL